MENRYAHLFCVIFTLNCLFLFFFFTEVKSASGKQSIIDIMKNDKKLCPTSKFLYDSEYIKPCASIAYPTATLKFKPETLNNFLCVGVYDTAYKICQYSSRLQIPLNSTALFNSYVEKYVPSKNEAQEKFCSSLQGFTLYNKTNVFWGQLVESFNTLYKCLRICFDFDGTFHPLCAVFAWIKSIDDDMTKDNKLERNYDLLSSDKLPISQSKGETVSDIIMPIGSKTTSEIKESKEQKQITKPDSNNNNNIKEGNPNMSGNVPDIKSDEEKTKSDTEKASNTQKKINNTSETQVHKSSLSEESKKNISDKTTKFETNAETAISTKNFPSNSDLPVASVNNGIDNTNKKVIKEEHTDKSNKEHDIDDFKTSTLSENTQDHYDGSPDEDVENNMDDVDDTIPHPADTGNQNENLQEPFEQKNDNAKLTEYSNMRTEDDSHFFTYFTVITLACLAGYIGYHNKQKILAIVLEGRRSRSNRGRRRPSTASYRKLDCTLEEAVTSQCNANVTHVIY